MTLESTQSGLFFNRTDQSKVGSASDVKHLIPHSHDGDSDSVVTSSHSMCDTCKLLAFNIILHEASISLKTALLKISKMK